MKIKYFILSVILVFAVLKSIGQEATTKEVFKSQPINFGGEKGNDVEALRLLDGRMVYKKVTVPNFKKGTDVSLKLTLRSNGDRWDKSGSCFVVANPEQISIIDVAKGEQKFPEDSYLQNKEYPGVLAGKDYKPVVEIMRFMTPFGVGFYSNDKGKHRKPVYIPVWEKQVVWEHDISDLKQLVTGTFYVGIWIDSWTADGYEFDLEFTYSNRKRKTLQVKSLVNTVPYGAGKSIPDNFSKDVLGHTLNFKKSVKNVKLHYITTGHGGHSGGDEFIKLKNSVYFNNQLVLDTIPWRDDCASFRRFNPTSGVWLKKDSASYIDAKAKAYKVKEIEERIASSDLSRSNWCPGSSVKPMVIDLGDLEAGNHQIKIKIPATKIDGDKLNHWLVSAYITYEE